MDIASGGESNPSATPAAAASGAQASADNGWASAAKAPLANAVASRSVGGGCLSDAERDSRQTRGKSNDERGAGHDPPAGRLLADEQAQGQQREDMCREHQGVQHSGAKAAHPSPLKKATPANAMAPPAVRTAIRPAGHRASRPMAIPVRWSNPVATTKPTE